MKDIQTDLEEDITDLLADWISREQLARALGLSGPQRSGFLLTSTFMNSGNFGLSITRFAFGDVGFQFAVIGYLTADLTYVLFDPRIRY